MQAQRAALQSFVDQGVGLNNKQMKSALTNLEKALNFDENVREESLIDWEALRASVPGEVARCMETFDGIVIADTRDCLLAALRRLRDPETAKNFEHNLPTGGPGLAGSSSNA